MSNAPAFQHYPGDFLSDPNVGLMSYEEIGIYWLLVNWCWKLGELPDDLDELTAYARASKDAFERMWTTRISKSFVKKDGGWVHPHLEAERRKHKQRKKQTSEAASARWGKQKTSVDANAMQTQCERITDEKSPALQTQCPSSSSSSSSSSSTSVSTVDKSTVEEATAKPSRPKGRRWGNDETVPEEWKDKLQVEFPNVDVELEARKFQNYWVSKSGKDATKVDWKKTFENWIISENQRTGKTAKPQQKTNKEKLAEYERYYDRLEKEAGIGRYSEQTPTHKRLGDA